MLNSNAKPLLTSSNFEQRNRSVWISKLGSATSAIRATCARYRQLVNLAWGAFALVLGSAAAMASDHRDAPTVINDPRADIGDLYAWVADDGRSVNLVMTIVSRTFADEVAYAFHIDSGRRFGATRKTSELVCRFVSGAADCRLDATDRAQGDASGTDGLEGARKRFRVYAGLRDDPFFNNVRGTRDAYNAAKKALASGATRDAAGCPMFSAEQSREILDRWHHTDGGPGQDFLRTWTTSAIVVTVDIDAVNRGGPLLAIWASTSAPNGQLDRAARPLTGNALLATLGTDGESDFINERYNRATPKTAAAFAAAIAKGVAFYDSVDGHCGNSLLIDRHAPPTQRYVRIARLLADDRLWVDSRWRTCTQLFAVERTALNGEANLAQDCGGRSLLIDAANVYRSLLVNGTTVGVDDGVHEDDRSQSLTRFPFLAAPDAAPTGP